jgi:hypothetical protein
MPLVNSRTFRNDMTSALPFDDFRNLLANLPPADAQAEARVRTLFAKADKPKVHGPHRGHRRVARPGRARTARGETAPGGGLVTTSPATICSAGGRDQRGRTLRRRGAAINQSASPTISV